MRKVSIDKILGKPPEGETPQQKALRRKRTKLRIDQTNHFIKMVEDNLNAIQLRMKQAEDTMNSNLQNALTYHVRGSVGDRDNYLTAANSSKIHFEAYKQVYNNFKDTVGYEIGLAKRKYEQYLTAISEEEYSAEQEKKRELKKKEEDERKRQERIKDTGYADDSIEVDVRKGYGSGTKTYTRYTVD